MVETRECVGERNCMERAAPSYHCRRPAVKLASGKILEHPRPASFGRAVDLRLINFGTPLPREGRA